MKRYQTWGAILCAAAIVTVGSCKVEEIMTEEAVKDVKGSWRIAKATRNGADITDKFDFSGFGITFNADGSYQLQQPIPFIVSVAGTYALDDPRYPFQIAFEQEGTDGTVDSEFEYPILDGQRALTLTFHPGCASNTYRYTLVRSGNQ